MVSSYMANFKWIKKNFDHDPNIRFGKWRMSKSKVSDLSMDELIWMVTQSSSASKLIKDACKRRLNLEFNRDFYR